MNTAAVTVKPRREPIRVLLVDDHEHVLWGLSKLIDGEWPRMMVIGMSRDMQQAKMLVDARAPDVIVLDIQVGGENALDSMLMLLASTRSDVIVYTSSRDADMLRRAVLAGAKCVVDKEAPAEMLLRKIEQVYRERTSGAAH